MPDLPEDVVAVEQEILDVLARSEARILVQQQAITDEIREGRKSARLDALLEQVRAEREVIETGTKNWLESAVPYTFNSGSVSTGLTDSAQWNRVNLSAVQEIIDFHYDEILAQTPYMEPAAKRWFRDAARAGNELSATTGLTRVQQARLIRSQAPQAFDPSGRPLPLAPVTYKNGSRHTMREYSNMLARTTTALTFNRGSLNTIEELGGAFVEVFDGADCGATGHDDPDLVNGTIRTLKWAQRHLISHPNAIMGGQVVETFGLPTEIVRARYSGPSVTVRTAQGHRLTVSPDHPIATPSGWVPARLLRPGDHVLCDCTNVEAVRNGADFYQQPLIEEVFAALVESFPNFTAVPAPDDLHGAAKCCDPEVDVVDPERLLLDHTLAEVAQMIGEAGLVVRDPKLPLEPGSGADLALLDALLASPHRLVGRSGRLTGVDLRGSELQSVGARQARQPGPCERLPEPTLGDVVLGGEIGEQFSAGGVAPMEIGEDVVVELAVGWHDGLVFDASTVGAAYLTSGVVVANCRRSFGARFDVTEEDLTQRSTSISREALADQARFERQLAARAAQRAATGRQARTGRVGRVARRAAQIAARAAVDAAIDRAAAELQEFLLREFRRRQNVSDDILLAQAAPSFGRRRPDWRVQLSDPDVRASSGDWRAPLIDDMDELDRLRGNWADEVTYRGRSVSSEGLGLPGDRQREALSAQLRIGRTVNDEVDRRFRELFQEAIDIRDSGALESARRAVLDAQAVRSDLVKAINRLDGLASDPLRRELGDPDTLREFLGALYGDVKDLNKVLDVIDRYEDVFRLAGIDFDLDGPLPAPSFFTKFADDVNDLFQKADRDLVSLVATENRLADASAGLREGLAQVRLDVLSEMRSFGTSEINWRLAQFGGEIPSWLRDFDMNQVSRYFPDDWIDDLNRAYDGAQIDGIARLARIDAIREWNLDLDEVGDVIGVNVVQTRATATRGNRALAEAGLDEGQRALTDLTLDELNQIVDHFDYIQGDVESRLRRYQGMEIGWTRDRAYATQGHVDSAVSRPLINVGTSSTEAERLSTLAHELMHHMDYTSDRAGQGWGFVTIRADDFTGNQLTAPFISDANITAARAKNASWLAENATYNRNAGFPNEYTARQYDLNDVGPDTVRSEVNTTGIQGYFFYEGGADLYFIDQTYTESGRYVNTVDRQFLDYMAGLLASM